MRNRYLDLLRAVAIVRVIVYHLFGWPWLSIVLPAMGIMFALAGSLAAASLENRDARRVITSRLRRLLPPVWLLGLIAVPLMVVAGWRQETDGDHPFSLSGLAFWILPLGDPTGSDLGIDAWEPLWYIRAYVWFILLSPVLFAFYRKAGWLAVASPLLVMGALDLTGFTLPDTADAALWDFVTYGACWMAGFAHHDGRLARMRPWVVVTAAVVLGGAALYWLRGPHGEDTWDLNDVSEAQALWSLAFVLLALRWQPPMEWLARARPLDRTVTLLNARAVTIYLWHNIAIAGVWPVLTVLALDDSAGGVGGAVDLVAAFALTVVAVLLFGWAEDLAARRRPRLWPSRTRAGTSTRTATTASPAPGDGPVTAPAGAPALAPPGGPGLAPPGGPVVPAPSGGDGQAGPVADEIDWGNPDRTRRFAKQPSAATMTGRKPTSWPPIPRAVTGPGRTDAWLGAQAAADLIGAGPAADARTTTGPDRVGPPRNDRTTADQDRVGLPEAAWSTNPARTGRPADARTPDAGPDGTPAGTWTAVPQGRASLPASGRIAPGPDPTGSPPGARIAPAPDQAGSPASARAVAGGQAGRHAARTGDLSGFMPSRGVPVAGRRADPATGGTEPGRGETEPGPGGRPTSGAAAAPGHAAGEAIADGPVGRVWPAHPAGSDAAPEWFGEPARRQ